MTEFDFEELDKAVSGLMSNVDTKKRNPALDDPEDKVVELSLPEAAPVTSAAAEPQPTPETPAPTATSAPALAVKRRGQFMDMIHPSSDMKMPARRPSRQGVTIAPVAPSVSAADAPVEPSIPPVFEPASEVTVPTPEPFVADVSAERSESAPAPLVSPFLPDAKPEKRPLGSPLGTEQAAIEELSQAPVAQEPEQPVNSGLPEELATDVLAVEANDLSNHPEAEAPMVEAAVATESEATSEPAEAEAAPMADIAEVATEAAPTLVPEPEEVPAPAPTTVPAGGSIAQQYDETPSSGDQTSGSIYDTASYHQAIDPVATKKKSSPVKFIFAFVVLLILGIGGGVVYFLLTQ